MSLNQVPLVTTLLRGSRDANEVLLKEAFRQILESGISKEDLNAVDKSGRTAISYICSTNMTKFLDLFLQLPGIDVNKPDNEGNTPLHFAAQSGQSECVNLLLTRCRSITVDAKNNLGFTPLMKAALQGRSRCAKLLLFAGASPVEVDYGRSLRAEQWARFVGRHTCAEMIEQVARARLLDKSTGIGRWSHDIISSENKSALVRTKTSPISSSTPVHQSNHTNSLRSKFRKVFPFGRKEKNTPKKDETYGHEIVSYLTAATLCVSGPALPKTGNKQMIKSILRPLQVPKLEVTSDTNSALIKKYETTFGAETTTKQTQPSPIAVTSRGKMRK